MVAVSLVGIYAACSDDDPGAAPISIVDAAADTVRVDPDTGTSCPPAAAKACTAAKCTTDLGEPATCVADACVKLRSVDCPIVAGATDSDDVIVIGAMLAQNGSNASSGTARINSVELAIKEINTAGGIPDPDKCKPARKLALVACDDSNIIPDGGTPAPDGGTQRMRAAAHLIDELKVPAIVGGSTSGNTLDIAKRATVPAKVMLFAPSSTAISITAPTDFNASPDGTRLLWRAAPSDVVQSKVLQLSYAALEAETKADGGPANVKLALVVKNDAYGKGIQSAFEAGLTVNGVAAAGNPNFTAIVYKNTPADIDGVLQAQAVTDLTTFAPDIIVMAGTSEATTGILQPYEATNPAKKPNYLLADGQRKLELLAAVEASASLRARMRGSVPGIVTALAQDFFNFRFKAAYPNNPQLSYGMAGSYDIAYMIAYAAAASKGAKVDGTTLAKNMAQLVGGTQVIDVGPQSLTQGMQAMVNGAKTDFNGASGPLNFDLASGEAPSDYTIWCVGIDPNTTKPIFNDATGQVYSAVDNKITGTYSCN